MQRRGILIRVRISNCTEAWDTSKGGVLELWDASEGGVLELCRGVGY